MIPPKEARCQSTGCRHIIHAHIKVRQPDREAYSLLLCKSHLRDLIEIGLDRYGGELALVATASKAELN